MKAPNGKLEIKASMSDENAFYRCNFIIGENVSLSFVYRSSVSRGVNKNILFPWWLMLRERKEAIYGGPGAPRT